MNKEELGIIDWLELIKEDRNLNGAYISISQYIYLVEKENKQLKDNWIKLREWVNKQYDYYMNEKDYIGGRLCFGDMKTNMQEIEQGSGK